MKRMISIALFAFLTMFSSACEMADTSSSSSDTNNSGINQSKIDISDETTTAIHIESNKENTEASTSSENHNGMSELPYSISEMSGKDYKDLTDDLKEKGFNNINYDIIDDLIIGFLKSDGEVEKVTINGDSDFSKGDWILSDSEIVISYHTFPSQEYETPDHNDSDSPSDEILTVSNCPELSERLSKKADMDPSYESFAQKYRGRTIEFDGRIDYITNHGNYDTRYDFLVSAGDYNPDTQTGPSFKLENISSSCFSSIKSDSLHIGDNVHISAEVGQCDSEHCLFYLESPKITDR